MKKIILIAFMFVFCMFFISCGEKEINFDIFGPDSCLVGDEASFDVINVTVDKYEMKIEAKPLDVVKVENGKVICLKEGVATITITIGDVSKSKTLLVEKKALDLLDAADLNVEIIAKLDEFISSNHSSYSITFVEGDSSSKVNVIYNKEGDEITSLLLEEFQNDVLKLSLIVKDGKANKLENEVKTVNDVVLGECARLANSTSFEKMTADLTFLYDVDLYTSLINGRIEDNYFVYEVDFDAYEGSILKLADKTKIVFKVNLQDKVIIELDVQKDNSSKKVILELNETSLNDINIEKDLSSYSN